MNDNESRNKSTGFIGNSLKSILMRVILKNLPVAITIILALTIIFFMFILVGGMFESISDIRINMSKEESEVFMKSTLGFFSPQKIQAYKILEDASYLENTVVKETVTIISNDGSKTAYEQVTDFNIGDMTKEHRIHWQLLACIDTLSGYAEKQNDNTVCKLAEKDLMTKYELSYKVRDNELFNFKYYKTFTEIVREEIKVDNTIVIITTKTTIVTPQPYAEKVSTAYFDIEYEYEYATISEDEVEKGNKTITRKTEGYVIKNINKTINNRLEGFLRNKEFKKRLTYKNIEEICDFGMEFPDSQEFGSIMLEYLALNPDVIIAARNYSGKEGTHTVTEDSKQFRVPVKFKNEDTENKISITSFFGPREFLVGGIIRKDFHRGLDFKLPPGTPIVAAADGKVINSKYYGTYGYYIEIEHEGKYKTVYAHNSKLTVNAGDIVKRGDLIALSGNTGLSTGPHLHFEIKYNDNIIDPYPKLNLKE